MPELAYPDALPAVPFGADVLSIDVLHTTLFCDDRFEATTKLWNDLAAV